MDVVHRTSQPQRATPVERVIAAASWSRLGVLFLVYGGLVSTLGWLEGRIKVFSGGLGVPDLWHGFTAPRCPSPPARPLVVR